MPKPMPSLHPATAKRCQCCRTLFVPRGKVHYYCSSLCQRRMHKRRQLRDRVEAMRLQTYMERNCPKALERLRHEMHAAKTIGFTLHTSAATMLELQLDGESQFVNRSDVHLGN